ncbi:unnamed protein product [Strongylus vulgaris]|uniref:Uncharacterized protein n=1 Tax=Strongylus vulgaris TaxID=40348 RepID=A0A3P7JW23_STRVU|nr:unnamed protein product [Strongylus vulgaris]
MGKYKDNEAVQKMWQDYQVGIFDEAKIPEGFAVAKFLDTAEVEWLPSLANVLTNDGKVDTKNLILANPTRFPEHTKAEERKL